MAIDSVNFAVGMEMLRFRGAAERRADFLGGILVEYRESLQNRLGTSHFRSAASAYCPWCMPRQVDGAIVRLSPEAGWRDVAHELMHAAGLGHTCIVPSMMATEFSTEDLEACGIVRGGVGYRSAMVLERSMSPYDAAALDILSKLTGKLTSLQVDSVVWIVLRGNDSRRPDKWRQ